MGMRWTGGSLSSHVLTRFIHSVPSSSSSRAACSISSVRVVFMVLYLRPAFNGFVDGILDAVNQVGRVWHPGVTLLPEIVVLPGDFTDGDGEVFHLILHLAVMRRLTAETPFHLSTLPSRCMSRRRLDEAAKPRL